MFKIPTMLQCKKEYFTSEQSKQKKNSINHYLLIFLTSLLQISEVTLTGLSC